MLKAATPEKPQEERALIALEALLGEIPIAQVEDIACQGSGPTGYDIDIAVHLTVAGKPHRLVCEVIGRGQPRYVRAALLQLRDYVHRHAREATPILIAPYLSDEAKALCRDYEVGFLDLEGNARITFDGVYIDRTAPTRTPALRRQLKSLYMPKSARILRRLLRDPARRWRVTDLAEAAEVSLGHVSNVRTELLNREWAQLDEHGLYLSAPDKLLDDWRDLYEAPAGARGRYYTTLHGAAFEDAAREALSAGRSGGDAAFAAFSAAKWIAPYGRVATNYFYSNAAGLERLKAGLQLRSAARGENVVITVPKDLGILRDVVEPAPGAVCTDPVQTYLDLHVAGERGREAAEHLRAEKLHWNT